MKHEFIYPSVKEIIEFHDRRVAESKESKAIINAGYLDFIVDYAIDRYNYIHDEQLRLCKKAAAFLYGITVQHPFLGGNKRTGFGIAMLFLELNARRVKSSLKENIALSIEVSKGKISREEVEKWILKRLRRYD